MRDRTGRESAAKAVGARITFAIACTLVVAGGVLLMLTRTVPVRTFGPRTPTPLIALAFATVGFAISSRHPRNAVGWILSAVGLIAAVKIVGGGYATLSVARHNGSLPLTDWIAWLQNMLWVPMMGAVQLAILLFPNGRMISPRWRWGLYVIVAGNLAFSASVLLGPERVDDVPVSYRLPYAGDASLAGALEVLGGPLFLGGWLASLTALVARYRRSRAQEREQMRWVATVMWVVAAAFLVVLVLELGEVNYSGIAESTVTTLLLFSVAGVAVAMGIAILRYRLYDIEVIINRTVVLAVLAVFITAVYVGVVAGIGTALGSRGGSNVALPIVATAMVGVAFQPVRSRAHRLANRFVYGKRATPYEALSGLAARAADARSEDDLVAGLAQLVAESTAARQAVVWMREGGTLRAAAVWPQGSASFDPQPFRQDLSTLPGASAVYPVLHHTDLLGAIAIDVGTETISAADDKLLSHLAAQAGILLRNLRESVPLPEGEVTFLMTDVQGSTRLWEEHPAEMATALSEHDALMRRLVAANDGILIKSRGEGDSTFSVFTDPAKAVAAAIAIQRAFEAYPWPTPRPLRVRAALHTGEAELRDRDYYGQVVNRCARLRSIADGGQTVLSSATFEAVENALPGGARISDLGSQQLKDLDEPERVYQVTTAG